MATLLPLEICTPVKQLLKDEVSEVVLPAFDGERGILPGHQDFVGMLGTGPLKIVRNGNDFWFMVSSGVYSVDKGVLRILAEVGEDVEGADAEILRSQLAGLEKELNDPTTERELLPKLRLQRDRVKARLDVNRRMKEVN